MLSSLLLSWYDTHGRTLPFRGTKDPYRVWVSEIMLQQTRTETVGAYYTRFLERFPDVFSLADAPEEDVLKRWEGLGYYSRARNLHKAAKAVVSQYGGVFPADVEALRALPGVGDYTAAAVASIAFDLPAPAMDGNLTRVLSRVHGVREDVGIPSVKRRLLSLAQEDMPDSRCGDYNQALMDLGATVCVPGTPDCQRCPLRPLCDAYRAGDAEDLPVKAAAKPPMEISLSVVIVTCRGRVLLTQRREALLNHLWVYCLMENVGGQKEIGKKLKALGVNAVFRENLGTARHVFTHRVWNMTLYHYEAQAMTSREGRFVTLREMRSLPMPTAMRAARAQAERLLTPRIEIAEESGLPSLAALYAEAWRRSHEAHCDPSFLNRHTPAYMESLLRRHIDAGRNVYSLSLSGVLAGVMALSKEENEIVLLYIHPDFQGVGIGSAAVAFAVSQLDGGREMKVTVLRDNENAIALYEKYGFTRGSALRLLDAERGLYEQDMARPSHQSEGGIQK